MISSSLPSFDAPKINHRLINRMVAMAQSYSWQKDKSLLVLRNVLNLRTRVRERFLRAITAVSSCLAFHAQLTPSTTPTGERVLFALPDYVYVSNIASQCNVSRYTVYRVLDYLSAIGDLVTHTQFDPQIKQYSPTQIILTESFYLRIGFRFDELKAAIRSVNKKAKDAVATKNKLQKEIKSNVKSLRKSVRGRLSKSAEGLLSNKTEKTEKNRKTLGIPSNTLLDSFVGAVSINRGTSAHDYFRSEACEKTNTTLDNYHNNREYMDMLNLLKEQGIPIKDRHKLACESLKNSN